MPSKRLPPPLFPPLPLDPISDNLPSDIISRDSSSSDSDTETAAKRGRMLKHAESYLRGEPLYLHSAGLRGPVVKNPWAKGKKQTKRKAMEIEEETWEEDMSKRLKRGLEEREAEPAPSQAGRNAMNMWSRGMNTTWDIPGPSTPTPLRTRPPEATNVPDRSHSRSHSPFDNDLLEFRTPVKKKPSAPIEVAPISIEDSSSHRRSSSAKKSSPPLEPDCSVSNSASMRKRRKEPLEVRDSTPRLRPRKNSPADITPDTPTQVRDTTPRLRPGRRPTTEPILEASRRTQGSGSRPRSTRSSTRASEPELELHRESQSASKQINTRSRTKSSESFQEGQSTAKHRSTRNSSKSMEKLEAQPLRQEQEQILDTIEVVPPAEVQLGDIDMKKKIPKIDFGALSPFEIAPERPKARRRQRGGGPGTKGKKLADAQTERLEVSGNMDIKNFAEPEVLQPVEDADAITYVPGPEDGPEMVEIMNKEIDPGLVDTKVTAVAEPNHPCGNVEVTSEEPSINLAVPEPEQEQVAEAEASSSSKDPIKEQVFQNWINRHVAASQKFSADHNRISIANLLSPAAESPVARRITSRGLENFVPDTPINGGKVVESRYNPITARQVEASAKVPAPLPSMLQPKKPQSPLTSHAATIDVPRSPDQLPQSTLNKTYQESPTQFDTTCPTSETQLVNQHESWQNTQHALLAAQKGFFEAIQESPDPLGRYPSTTITPGRDLLRPIRFFDDENQPETPANIDHFGDGYKIGGKSPFKTPGMENVQWTAEPDESLLKTLEAESRDGEIREEAILKIPSLQWADRSYEAEEETILKTPELGNIQWTVEPGPGPGEREESPPKTPPSRTLSPFKLSFDSEKSGTAFTPFHAFATPKSSPKANIHRESSPHAPPTLDVHSISKKAVKFAQSLFGNDVNDESRQNDDTISFSNEFSPVLGVEPQDTESLLEEVKGFMGEGVWDAVAEAQKIAGNDAASTTPSGRGEKKEYMSARKRRALSKKKI